MTIVFQDEGELSEKGHKDAERHRQKIDKAIRENVRDVIGNESIITRKGKKKVKVTVKGLKDYRFIYGDSNSAGVGQGEGEPGDIIDQRPKDDEGNGPQAGQEEGEDLMETEVDIDYLLQIMFEDLGLPWIEEKTKANKLVPKGWKFENISKVGIKPRIHKKKTMMESIKRNILTVSQIVKDTNCSRDDGNKALAQANGDINKAIEIIRNGKLTCKQRRIFIDNSDFRFKQMEEDIEYHSNAVVIAMMDVSGSMGPEKKYLCRSLLFWMTQFLKKKYDFVDIKFIQHTTTAKVVDEDEFFNKAESGGTNCYTAFEKANYIIDTEYPLDEWNVYCVYVGDGEDWDNNRTITKIGEMLDKKINMLGYVEIDTEENPWNPGGTLINTIKQTWKFTNHRELGTDFYRNNDKRFLLSVIKDKKHVEATLRHFLFQPGKEMK